MSKSFRHGQILKLIREQNVFTQDALAAELSKRGITATQVTLSRDLREIGLVKTPNGYREMTRDNNASSGFEDLFAEYVTDVRLAQNLIVLKTDPGNASPVAVALDAQNWPELVGTIAGDDTVLLVAGNSAAAKDLQDRLLQLLTR